MFLARVFFFPHSRTSKEEEEENCISRFAPIRGARVSWMRRSFHSSFCFLLPFSLGEIRNDFSVSRKNEMADERKDTFGKERTKGVRVHRGVLTRAGEFLPFFFLLFSLSSSTSHFFFLLHRRRRSQRRLRRMERANSGKDSSHSFFWNGIEYLGEFDSLKSECLPFFFWLALHRRKCNLYHCINLQTSLRAVLLNLLWISALARSIELW